MTGCLRARVFGACLGIGSCAIAIACTFTSAFDELGPASNPPFRADAVAGDGTLDVLDAKTRWCDTSTHLFCLDFDDDQLTSAGAKVTSEPHGTAELSKVRAESPPSSFLSTLERTVNRAVSGTPTEQVTKRFDGDWRPARVDFECYLEPAEWQPTDINIFIAEVSYFSQSSDTNNSAIGYYLSLGSTSLELSVATRDKSTIKSASRTIVPGVWTHVRIEVDPSVSTNAAKVYLDDMANPVVVIAGVNVGENSHAEPTFELAIGLDDQNPPTPQFRMYYDDITADFIP